ncbi:NADP-dependent oxidoreductase [Chryseolinea lacunae]|uniref:NADP-dependent oxidoreductase n=1 Tax=Chryseolinea lacunae TaxID=2801331 RepID=A0ABS1KLV5_9BACT|nr:NADP-dependent oxidoreductase [Chryseolinea lacunae]MBL0740440.1 NADP-dependent oxidoreductase [Chryseolinea lacunae]
MKAIQLNEFGGIEHLVQVTPPQPVPLENELLVQVKAVSINPVDVKTRAGKGMSGRLKEYMPLILGWDISGTIAAVGNQVKDFVAGDEVFGMVNFPGHGKAYAEYVTTPAAHVTRKPVNIDHPEAAAATLAALTAWEALTQRAKIQPGQSVLIHAGAGGVGHYAVQMARHLGAHVIATSSSANKDFIRSLGAHHHVDYTRERFEDTVHDVDFVLDTMGGETLERSVAVVKPGGTLISIPTAVPPHVVDLARAKNANAYFFLVQSNGDGMRQVAQWLEAGIVKSHVSHIFPFDEMGKAHLQLETGRTKGKIVVTV